MPHWIPGMFLEKSGQFLSLHGWRALADLLE